MTKQELIKKFEVMKRGPHYDSQSETEGYQNALSMAIAFASELDESKECVFIETNESDFDEWFECSRCKRRCKEPSSWLKQNAAVDEGEDFNFCPNCGAKIKR